MSQHRQNEDVATAEFNQNNALPSTPNNNATIPKNDLKSAAPPDDGNDEEDDDFQRCLDRVLLDITDCTFPIKHENLFGNIKSCERELLELLFESYGRFNVKTYVHNPMIRKEYGFNDCDFMDFEHVVSVDEFEELQAISERLDKFIRRIAVRAVCTKLVGEA